MAQSVKSLPAVWEIQVQFLGWEDALEKEMATLSSILTWRTLLSEGPVRLRSMGVTKSPWGSQSQTRLSD